MSYKKRLKYIPKHCKEEMKPTGRQGGIWTFKCKKCGHTKDCVEW